MCILTSCERASDRVSESVSQSVTDNTLMELIGVPAGMLINFVELQNQSTRSGEKQQKVVKKWHR